MLAGLKMSTLIFARLGSCVHGLYALYARDTSKGATEHETDTPRLIERIFFSLPVHAHQPRDRELAASEHNLTSHFDVHKLSTVDDGTFNCLHRSQFIPRYLSGAEVTCISTFWATFLCKHTCNLHLFLCFHPHLALVHEFN